MAVSLLLVKKVTTVRSIIDGSKDQRDTFIALLVIHFMNLIREALGGPQMSETVASEDHEFKYRTRLKPSLIGAL